MNILHIIALILLQLTSYASCEAQIVFREVVVGDTSTKIIRQSPIIGRYTLVKSHSTVFPDLHDRFYLGKAQRVSIFYTITSRTSNFCALQTWVNIDNVRHDVFNYVSQVHYQRTHTQRYSVWLQPGYHTVQVWFWTNGDWINLPSNREREWLDFGLLEIEYLEYSS